MNDFCPFNPYSKMEDHHITSSTGTVHPLPISYYVKQSIASRSTLWRWRQEGLRILKVGGRAYISPTELVRFMEKKHEETNL